MTRLTIAALFLFFAAVAIFWLLCELVHQERAFGANDDIKEALRSHVDEEASE
jgi:hypothetical protein